MSKPGDRTVNVGVLNDVGGEPDKEFKTLKKQFSRKFSESGIKARFAQWLTFSPQPSTDCVLFDYGGMLPGCQSLTDGACRSALTWASENPKKLLIVVSTCTWDWYILQIMDELGLNDDALPNVYVDRGLNEDGPLPDWFIDQFKSKGAAK